MSYRGEVLVAILNKELDFAILREKHWYRIPVPSVDKWLAQRWPPEWLAFYQTKVFGEQAHSVNYYAQVHTIRQVSRQELFPNEALHRDRRYYQIFIEPLQALTKPIYSQRFRRIIFIPTTWEKFTSAFEINDLYDESSLEDRLWAAFKHLRITAERQEFVTARKHDYALDFAIYCAKGNIDVETDGDFWHANPEKAAADNLRDHDVKTAGWKVLRFTTRQIMEQTEEYCIPTIVQNINGFGGLEEGKSLPRKIDMENSGIYQLSLFDDMP